MTKETLQARDPKSSGGQMSESLELLASMGRDFAASLDIEETLKKALESITKHMDAEGGAIFLLEENETALRCHACVGAADITGMSMGANDGVVGRCVSNNVGEIVRDVSSDPGFYQMVDEQTGLTTRSILCAPMSVQDQRIGAIELINRQGGDGLFRDLDLQVLQTLSTSAALAILNARMAEALVEQERVRRELELAAEIQRSLLPKAGSEDFCVHGINYPARVVSGDFYDFFSLDDGRIYFNLGDVSGKGMNAALLMAKTASIFRCLGKTIHHPGRLLALVNAEICETVTRGMFVTMVGGIFDPKTGVVRFANSGHEPPLYQNRDGTFRSFEADSPPLGIVAMSDPDEAFPETEVELDGGTFYIFTDGVTEGHLADGGELGVEGVKEILGDLASLSGLDRIKDIVSRIDHGDGVLHDDLTMMVIDDAKTAHDRKGQKEMPVSEGLSGKNASDGPLLKLEFLAKADRLKQVRRSVKEAAQTCGCSQDVAEEIVLAVDEACQNIIRHAYEGKGNGEITLEFWCQEETITVFLRDYAKTVDVSQIKPRDLGDLRPGGLGTHFIREVMDEVVFMEPPPEGGNLLRLAKRIK
jgi:phosphoserine phosphatase RsbU/P